MIDVLQKSKETIISFLKDLTQNLDFELAVKTNPRNQDGQFQEGKFEVINIYRKQGRIGKNLIQYLILYPITETNKAIPAKLEDPIENALRTFVKGLVLPSTPPAPVTPAPVIPEPEVTLPKKLRDFVLDILGGEFQDEGRQKGRLNGISRAGYNFGSWGDVTANFGGVKELAQYLRKGGIYKLGTSKYADSTGNRNKVLMPL